MSAAIAIPGNTASTFLTHFFGSGLSDDTAQQRQAEQRGDEAKAKTAHTTNNAAGRAAACGWGGGTVVGPSGC